jgi:subtilisin-like proprotein convertase family protein/subtilisin family serine protease
LALDVTASFNLWPQDLSVPDLSSSLLSTAVSSGWDRFGFHLESNSERNTFVANEKLRVGDDVYSIAVRPDRVAIPTSSIPTELGQIFDEWDAFEIRPLNDAFTLYEVGPEFWTSAAHDISAVIDQAIPVLRVEGASVDSVLLDELVVQLKPDTNPNLYFTIDPRIESWKPLPGTQDQFIVTVSSYGLPALRLANEIAEDPRVVWSSPNFYQDWQRYYLPNDARLSNQWYASSNLQGPDLSDIDVDLAEAWDINPGGSSNITIAIVDDGVAIDHPDLLPWMNTGEIANNGIDDDGNGWTDDVYGWNFSSNTNESYPTSHWDRHGTVVAGLAAARGDNAVGIAGAAYRSRVMSARIFNAGMPTTDANIASALYYAAGRTASGSGTWKAADVINGSWGGGAPSSIINSALTWGTSNGRMGKGASFFFAAGNESSGVSQPAAQSLLIPGVFAVGAINSQGSLSNYSNAGPSIDFVLPSDDLREGYLGIDSTDRMGAEGYHSSDYVGIEPAFGGTSASSGLATGIAALVLAQADATGSELSPYQLKRLLQSNTDLVDATHAEFDAVTGRDHRYGFGRLNAASAVQGVGRPEISVITADQELESSFESVDFGTVAVGEMIDVTFRVRNQGTSVLMLKEPVLQPGPFQLLIGISKNALGIGGSTTFTVRLSSTTMGDVTRSLVVASNDASEPNFVITLKATVVTADFGGSVFEDWNGNGIRDEDDRSLSAGQVVYLDANNNGLFDAQREVVQWTQSNPLAIPDLGTVSSSLIVSGMGNFITDVNVRLNIDHTMASDLTFFLISPTGKSTTLFARQGGRQYDFDNVIFDDQAIVDEQLAMDTWTGTILPFTPLAQFEGDIANGEWRLLIEDGRAVDDGTLIDWSLEITTGEHVARTQDNGYFRFHDLPVGTHVLRPIIPAGFIATGNDSYSLSRQALTDSHTQLHFGIAKTNRFYGLVYNDLDADGIQDVTERGLPHWVAFWDHNHNGVLDSETLWTVASGSVDQIVPDQTTRIFDLPVLGGVGTLTDVNVMLNIEMNYDADLRAFLIHPDGTRIELFTQVGGTRDDFLDTVFDDSAAVSIRSGVAPFTGVFRPEGSLADLHDKLPNGVWKLELTDLARDYQAVLHSWELRLQAAEPSRRADFLGAFSFDLPAEANQSIRVLNESDWSFTVPALGVRDVSPAGAPMFQQLYGIQSPPVITVDRTYVAGFEGQSTNNSGTWSDQDSFAEDVTIDASLGSVIKHMDGTWTWFYTAPDQRAITTVTVTVRDSLGNSQSIPFQFEATNAAPTLTRSNVALTGNVLSTFLNTGAYGDVPDDSVTLTASVGTLIRNENGTWNWSYVPSSRLFQSIVTITANDEDGGSSSVNFAMDALVAVTKFQSYYQGSDYQVLGGINAALETTKQFLRPNAQVQTAGPDNIINWMSGINGVVLDVAGLANQTLSTADFQFRVSPPGAREAVTPASWSAAPSPQSISVIPGTSTTPARIVLNWPNNAIQNTWLQIMVKSNANTGLAEREVFYVGHAMAEMNFSTPYRVTAVELSMVQSAISNAILPVTNVRDINKDRRVTAFDLSFVQSRIANTVLLHDIYVPPKNSVAEGEAIEACMAMDVVAESTSTGLAVSETARKQGPHPGPSSRVTPQIIDFPDDGTLRFDEWGLAYFYDPGAMESEFGIDPAWNWNGEDLVADGPSITDKAPTSPTLHDDPSPLTVPAYHSNPGFPKKIYLDFDGQTISGTTWNNQNYTGAYNTGSVINAPAFSLDADRTTFTASELTAIYETWVRVSEDYAPFQVDVTTESPPESAFTAGGQAIRVMVSTDFDASNNTQWYPNAGGVAYLNSWNWTNGSPVWVFTNRLGGSAKNFAEASSHEVGHAFGLSHDGRTTPAENYYAGHGSGATGWAPIMGVGYSRSLTQWSQGEYANANNTQDDLLRISNAIGYIADDHGNTISVPTQLTVGSNGAVAASGLITTRSDVDVFRFATQSGLVSLQVNPLDVATSRGNLDVSVTLRDAAGTEVVTVNELDLLGTTMTRNLAKGFYTLAVDGTGRMATSNNPGYSDYASIGQFTLSGTVVPNQAPTALPDAVTTGPLDAILVDVLANDSDANLDTFSILNLGTPAVGAASLESGKIRYQIPALFFGEVVIGYTIVDELGATATSTLTIQVVPNAPPILTSNQLNVAGNEGTIITNQGTWSDPDIPSNVVTLVASAGSIVKNDNGTWAWQISTIDQVAPTTVIITATDGLGGVASTSFTYSATNLPPVLQLAQSSVTADVLTPLSNVGSWADASNDAVALTASLGTVTRFDNGTWAWSYVASSKLTNQLVTITATDKDNASSSISFTINALVAVSARRIYYRGSDHEVLVGIDAAMDTSKSLLASSNIPLQTSSENVTNYVHGINGLIFDIAGLVSSSLTVNDFLFRIAPPGVNGIVNPSQWPAAPVPFQILVQPGTVSTPARVQVDWTDGAIQNTWLQVTLLANERTGLANRQVYYVGHAMGDVAGGSPYRVTALDLSMVQSAISTTIVAANDARDINRDRRVTAFDLSFVQSRIANTVLLQDIVIPVLNSGEEGEGARASGGGKRDARIEPLDYVYSDRQLLAETLDDIATTQRVGKVLF